MSGVQGPYFEKLPVCWMGTQVALVGSQWLLICELVSWFPVLARPTHPHPTASDLGNCCSFLSQSCLSFLPASSVTSPLNTGSAFPKGSSHLSMTLQSALVLLIVDASWSASDYWLLLAICLFHFFAFASAWASVTKYPRLGNLNNRHLFSQFWRLDIQDQGAGQSGVQWGFSPCL